MYLVAIISPFLGSVFAGLGGRFCGSRGSTCVTIYSLIISCLCSTIIYYEVCCQGCTVYIALDTWFKSSSLVVDWSLRFDSLTACLMVTVTWVSLCVHIYSVYYMESSPHLPRFMAYLSLFTGFMLVLVSASNLAQLLVGWEGIGVCSYFLIGFWLSRLNATKSALQAMLVNRVSDTVLIISLFVMWFYYGSLDYDILWATTSNSYYNDYICFALLVAACGKSAQLAFHIWLASAMEGPTPVSALIHAATLVTAGVFLIARTSQLWECSPLCKTWCVIIGATTSLVAASCGLFQNDIKKVIAYSTCSQLGYMVVSCGLGDYGFAIYHLMTHAGFKALLFLSAGAIIHSMSDVQDIRRFGGIQNNLVFVYTCFVIGSLSLTGFPFLSGFYSKDSILELAFNNYNGYGFWAYMILMIVASMTSFYSFRLLFCSFVSDSSSTKTSIINNFSYMHYHILLYISLSVLCILSIVIGYLLYDSCAGLGTNFWHGVVAQTPQVTDSISNHLLPSIVSFLPILSILSGFLLAAGYSWLIPVTNTKTQYIRNIYNFVSLAWLWNVVINQQIVYKIFLFAGSTLRLLDKGVLSWAGPTGLMQVFNFVWIPRTRILHTGSVYDYALVYKICVLFGIFYIIGTPLTENVSTRSLFVLFIFFWF
uniref:NADH-ubiquinone oxidoreductase chain 5 n=1 Tax=Jenufa minuta TaxID=993092 RepID=A0A6G7IT05_JENMI|nr:NADH dehydrogenase subunit 5 [Jenufa minuta]QII41637.1 NADH dehydrogenase subunit 5 [Jenufa minuta]